MPSPAAPFKTARQAALAASSALATAMGGAARVFDRRPTNLKPPYVLTGQDQILLDPNGDCPAEAEVYSTIHLWTLREGDDGDQARAIGAAIVDVMLGALSVDGWEVDLAELVDEQYLTDPDGSTHGIVTVHHDLTQSGA
jgi:hypothetical protein